MKKLIRFALSPVLVFALFGCDKSQGASSATTWWSDVPLMWEQAHPEGKSWSDYLIPLIETELSTSFLPGSNDMNDFCPNYPKFDDKQKVLFWAYLVSAITKYESEFNPTSRMSEPSLGVDKVTKTTVYSEGLMQLSYQDAGWIPTCAIDWSKDKNLSATDPRKTILDPYINLNCGVRVLANQVKNTKRIALSSGVYWSVLTAGSYKLRLIQQHTRSMSGCNSP